jgi:hypothetical protein
MVSYEEYIRDLKKQIPKASDEDLKANLYYFKYQLFTDGIALIEAEIKRRALLNIKNT